MNFIYCSYMSREISPGVYCIEAILDPSDPASPARTKVYTLAVTANLDVGGDTTQSSMDPNQVVFENGAPRVRNQEDELPGYRITAKSIISDMKGEWIAAGAPTTVLDLSGNPIVMDCDYSDKSNLEGLIMIMQGQGMAESQVRDHYNVSHVLPLASIQKLITDMTYYVAGTFYRKWGMQAQIDACTTKAAMEAVLGRSF